MVTMINNNLKSFVALSGNKSPQEYIALGKLIEDLGFDRIYVYDDLLDNPAWPILSLIAEHTKSIELGPCLVSGLYSHPIRIARNAVFLNELSNGRSVLGVGKGAFFDFIGIDYSEQVKTEACIETISLIRRLLAKDSTEFKGELFKKAENVILQANNATKHIPTILGSCDEKMAYNAGQFCDEFQTGENWDLLSLKKLYNKMQQGSKLTNNRTPYFSIGGVTCISENTMQCYDIVRPLLVQYIPYLESIVNSENFPLSKKELEQIKYYSSINDIKKASSYISDEVVDRCALVGSPERVIQKLKVLQASINLHGISFGPPYGTYGTIQENLEFIRNEVVAKLN